MPRTGPRPASTPLPLLLLRGVVGLLLGIHGVYRVAAGGVAGFGGFLTAAHLPFGLALAWMVTAFEIAGATALLLGMRVRLVGSGFLVLLALGIALVHGREGWFVVGGGRNGVEYSVLLMACLLVLILSQRRRRD